MFQSSLENREQGDLIACSKSQNALNPRFYYSVLHGSN